MSGARWGDDINTSPIVERPTPPNKERKLTTEFVRQDLAQNSSTTAEPDRVRVIREGVASYLPDIDPEETAEWLESFDDLLERSGPTRARYLMLRLLERSGEQRVAIPALTSTDYVNTIPTELEPWFPGDEDVERRYRAWMRWNAAIMVHRAQRPGVGVGGHISTYASSAALYEVGFNHFFRGKSHPGGGDQVFIQGHASPGIYARAFLEGRLTADQLDGFRQEHSHPGGGPPSYPHPRLMPDFWEFPTVSMGLIDRVHRAEAHGDRGELPEVRHQPRVRVGRDAPAGV